MHFQHLPELQVVFEVVEVVEKHTTHLAVQGGRVSQDRQEWKEEIQQHCEQRYQDPHESPEACEARLQHFARKSKALSFVLQARCKLKTGKCAGGGDHIVTEMLKCLPIIIVCYISILFAERFCCLEPTHIPSWPHIILAFVPKIFGAMALKFFSGISLLSLMGLWYRIMLLLLWESYPPPLSWQRVCITGFEHGVSTDYVLAPLRWSLFILQGDIWQAFDSATLQDEQTPAQWCKHIISRDTMFKTCDTNSLPAEWGRV
jgi:hypothetical protein